MGADQREHRDVKHREAVANRPRRHADAMGIVIRLASIQLRFARFVMIV